MGAFGRINRLPYKIWCIMSEADDIRMLVSTYVMRVRMEETVDVYHLRKDSGQLL